jgi:hypothetical protein
MKTNATLSTTESSLPRKAITSAPKDEDRLLQWNPPPSYEKRAVTDAALDLDYYIRRHNQNFGLLSTEPRSLPPETFYDGEYSELQSNYIRLLVLKPASRDSSLHCSFKTFPLGDTPSFVAISWIWGLSSQQDYIVLSGRETLITFQLGQILRDFRDLYHPTVFWVDALCINHSDIGERSHQIVLMPRIFSIASSVRIWLGDSTASTQLAFAFAKWISKSLDALERKLGADLEIPLAAFSALMRHPWFRRKWSIQEIAFSGTVMLFCGQDYLSWDIFADAVVIIKSVTQRICQSV